jgi:hypothetical protein
MRRFLICMAFLLSSLSHGQDQRVTTLKSVLLGQLRSTHNRESEWFVPLNKAVAGLTPAEATWTDGSGNNHSVGQLAAHLVLWDRQELTRFEDGKIPYAPVKDDGAFNTFDQKTWNATVRSLRRGWNC